MMNANVSLRFIDLDSSSGINPEMHDRAKLVWEMNVVEMTSGSEVYRMVLYVLI